MKRGKYLGGGIGLRNCGKHSACPALQYPNRYAPLPRLHVAMVAAFRPDALSKPVVHIGCSLRLGKSGEVCFPVPVVAYLAQTVLGERQW